jgi:hypothetical protein
MPFCNNGRDNLPSSYICCWRVCEMTTYVLSTKGKGLLYNIVHLWHFNAATNQYHLDNHCTSCVLYRSPPSVATRLKHNDSHPRNNQTPAPWGLSAADYSADCADGKTASYRRWYKTNIAEGTTSTDGSTISVISTSWEGLCGDWWSAWVRPNNGGSISGSRGRRYPIS